jgi:peptide/nickel transport system ATP-binding protein
MTGQSATASVIQAGRDVVAEVNDLSVHFVTRNQTVKAVNGVNFSLVRGEVLCILGETGCGKSVTMRAMVRLLPHRSTRMTGRVRITGHDVTALNEVELADLRGREVAMIFQEPVLAFDPVYTIGQQIVETIRRHLDYDNSRAWRRAHELLEMVQIPSPARCLDAYPHELSGGMCQRAMIGLALSCRPSLLLADEPTTALDATVQIQILLLLRRLQRELNMAVVLVTHDIGVASEIADRVAVMYAGRIVELGAAEDVILRPQHPYTQGLLASSVHHSARRARLSAIAGAPPDPTALPPGCAFAPRCPHASTPCIQAYPEEYWSRAGHMTRCILRGSVGRQPRPVGLD